MLRLFSVKVSAFDTVRSLKCFVVNFANLGEISGGSLAGAGGPGREPSTPPWASCLALRRYLFPHPEGLLSKEQEQRLIATVRGDKGVRSK